MRSAGGPDVGKEALGVLAGLGVFGGAVAAGIPVLFAAGAGAVAFATAYALTPRRKTPAEILLAPEVTQQMLDDYVRRGRGALDRIRELNLKIDRRTMGAKIDALCETLDRILANCEKDPSDIRAARSLPFYVEKIEEYVRGYVTLLEAGEHDRDVLQRLDGTEAMIVRATGKFEDLYKAMLENDLRALEAKAGALSMEFGSEEPVRSS